jgi:hypothetical protein
MRYSLEITSKTVNALIIVIIAVIMKIQKIAVIPGE